MYARIQIVLSEWVELFRGGGISEPTVGPTPNDKCRPKIVALSVHNFKPSFQGIRTSIAKKPYIFVIFQGGGECGGSGSAQADTCLFTSWKSSFASLIL